MATPLKEGLNPSSIQRLASELSSAFPDFREEEFVAACVVGLDELELKERVRRVSQEMRERLPNSYLDALAVVKRTALCWKRGPDQSAFSIFAAWPLFQFIEDNGCNHPKDSLEVLAQTTHLFTGEFAVRPLLLHHQKKTFETFLKWTQSENEHVRRLASEGCRPRLPWATQVPSLISDPAPGLKVLERLKDDPSEYVRRSVGNHLNDVAKDHPELVIDVCEQWSEGASKGRRWIIERATRTLVKEAHPRVWKLLGFAESPKLTVTDFQLKPKRLLLGGELHLSFDLASSATSPQRLAIDYAIHFIKKDGSARPKVFKLKVLELRPGSKLQVTKKQPLRPISTRKYYPGQHRVELLINGESRADAEFTLML